MPNTAPVNDSPEITAWMQHPDRSALINVFPVAAATMGSAGQQLTDFKALQRAGAVAVTDDGKPRLGENMMRGAQPPAAGLRLAMVQAADGTRGTAGASRHSGATAFRPGLQGIRR